LKAPFPNIVLVKKEKFNHKTQQPSSKTYTTPEINKIYFIAKQTTISTNPFNSKFHAKAQNKMHKVKLEVLRKLKTN